MNNKNNNDDLKEKLLKIPEVCKMLNCHPNTLRKWDRNGILTAVRIGNRNDRRYREQDVLNFLKEKPHTDTATDKYIKFENLPDIFSKVIESSPASIIITNTNGNIEYVNPKFT